MTRGHLPCLALLLTLGCGPDAAVEPERCPVPSPALVDCSGACGDPDALACDEPATGFIGNVRRSDVSYVVEAGQALRFGVVWAHCSRFTSAPDSGVVFAAARTSSACLVVNNDAATTPPDRVESTPAAGRSWLRVETMVVNSGSCTLACP